MRLLNLSTLTSSVALIAALAMAPACGKKDAKAPAAAGSGAASGTAGDSPTGTSADKKVEPTGATKVNPQAAALKGMAVGLLKAFKAKDLKQMVAFAPPGMAEQVKNIKPGDDDHKRMFDENNWRWKSAAAWDGKIKAVRFSGDNKAWVHFHNISDDELAVAAFRKADGKWFFNDFKSPSKKLWDEWGQPKQ